MKKLSFLSFVFITILSFNVLLSSCSSENSEEVVPQQEVEITAENELSEVEEGILAFFEFREDPNQVLHIFHTSEGLDWNVYTDYQYENGGEEDKHDFQSKDSIKFARWCDKQLKAGKCLKIGKTGDYYHADYVKC